jgi:hypothetical protein
MIGWIEPFQEHVVRIERAILALTVQHEQLSNNDRDEFTIGQLVLFSNHLSLWIQAIPHDELFWEYVGYRNVVIRLSHDLHRLMVLLDTLAHHQNMAGPGSHSLQIPIKALQEDCKELSERTGEIPKQPQFRIPSRYEPRSACIIVAELCFLNYPEYVNQPYSAFQLTEWPLVQYDFHFTGMIQHSLIAQLFHNHQLERVNLSVKRTSTFFEIAVTHPSLHLRPDIWERLMVFDPNKLENLRSIGGTLEPLTWNEGQGEGVIVKLPWVSA